MLIYQDALLKKRHFTLVNIFTIKRGKNIIVYILYRTSLTSNNSILDKVDLDFFKILCTYFLATHKLENIF